MQKQLAVGADVGGTHITAALVDPESKEMIAESVSRVSTTENSGVDELIDAWSGCIREAMGKHEVSKVCLAMPGPFNYHAGICLIKDQNKYPGLYGVNVRQRLADRLGISPEDIYMNNDAGCFLQGEVFCGSLTEFRNVIGVTLGTGLGTAVCKDFEANSADLWNMPFRDSIAENYISSNWFITTFNERTGRNIKGVKELVGMYDREPLAKELFDEFGKNLGLFLNTFIKLHRPEAVVIGGNIANALPLFEKTMKAQIVNNHPDVVIRQSVHGENAALIGAVGSWFTREAATSF
ncbi:MAG: ROK family protein [Flavitalea sp.]